MSHYAESPAMVRMDIFKPGGKWYETTALDMSYEYLNSAAPTAVESAVTSHYGPHWYEKKMSDGWTIVVAEPYNQFACPVMLVGAKA